jgi:hypothetical protein
MELVGLGNCRKLVLVYLKVGVLSSGSTEEKQGGITLLALNGPNFKVAPSEHGSSTLFDVRIHISRYYKLCVN